MTIDTKNTDWKSYINMILLAVIMSLSVLAFNKIAQIHDSQELNAKEMVRINTTQLNIIRDIDALDTRVKALELSYITELRNYMDDNFVRKPQK